MCTACHLWRFLLSSLANQFLFQYPSWTPYPQPGDPPYNPDPPPESPSPIRQIYHISSSSPSPMAPFAPQTSSSDQSASTAERPQPIGAAKCILVEHPLVCGGLLSGCIPYRTTVSHQPPPSGIQPRYCDHRVLTSFRSNKQHISLRLAWFVLSFGFGVFAINVDTSPPSSGISHN